MMRQSWSNRLLGLLLMPLFATGAWIAPVLQVCPMHGSPGSAHSSMAMASMAMASAAGLGGVSHATHSARVPATEAAVAHAAAAHAKLAHAKPALGTSVSSAPDGAAFTGDVSDAQPEHGQHGCDCLGCCCGTNGPALPEIRPEAAPTAIRDRSPADFWQAGVVPLRIAFAHPFATAPPVTRA